MVHQVRHRSEFPLLVMGGVLSLIGLLILLGLIAAGDDIPAWLNAAVLGLLAGPLLVSLYFIRCNYAQLASNAVAVTPDQFPEVCEIFRDKARRMGLADPDGGMNGLPHLYVSNGNCVLNAYATKCQITRAYVVTYNDSSTSHTSPLTSLRCALPSPTNWVTSSADT